MNSIVNKPFLLLIKGYQYFLSPIFGTQCRFHPSCSNYAYQAIETHGLFKGLFLTMKRVLRCNPWAKGGLDPVPPCDCLAENITHSHHTPK
ncbi:MAG: membrane protein insertion efficiency factor YidD [Hahellaceae bacterium]|nr:membrane protein insertion efficiency factor YidD [Hahellaceae bacterium]MCP5210054.1 membrane protein insertion efficiency factor YidD [Hahellaceae bacterium]